MDKAKKNSKGNDKKDVCGSEAGVHGELKGLRVQKKVTHLASPFLAQTPHVLVHCIQYHRLSEHAFRENAPNRKMNVTIRGQ